MWLISSLCIHVAIAVTDVIFLSHFYYTVVDSAVWRDRSQSSIALLRMFQLVDALLGLSASQLQTHHQGPIVFLLQSIR